MVAKILRWLFPKKKTRVGFKCVLWAEAEPYLKAGWTIAKEEDTNRVIGVVFLEKLEEVC
jgi:hypothetical protein